MAVKKQNCLKYVEPQREKMHRTFLANTEEPFLSLKKNTARSSVICYIEHHSKKSEQSLPEQPSAVHSIIKQAKLSYSLHLLPPLILFCMISCQLLVHSQQKQTHLSRSSDKIFHFPGSLPLRLFRITESSFKREILNLFWCLISSASMTQILLINYKSNTSVRNKAHFTIN